MATEPALNTLKPSVSERLATGRAGGVHLGNFMLRHCTWGSCNPSVGIPHPADTRVVVELVRC